MSPVDKKIAAALQGTPKLVSATAALMEELVRVLMREIEVVTQRKLAEHPELVKYKQRLAMDYRSNMKALAGAPDMLKKLPKAAQEALREMARRLKEATAENARMLRAATDATRQLIQNIVAMVRSEVLPQKSYKNPAKAHLQLGNYSPTCQPVAISRTV